MSGTPQILSRDELVAIERAAVRGWPAIDTVAIDGWLARWSSGGSVRANTVAALDFKGDLDRALGRVVQFYRDRGGVPKILITEVSEPSGLDAELERRGWQRHGAHVTLTKHLAASPIRFLGDRAGVTVERHTRADQAWADIYLGGLSVDRRACAHRLADGTPEPRAFFSGVRNGEVIACGLTVLDGTLASVQCMGTSASARRTGAATAILTAIELYARANGVSRLYLQTDEANHGALALYAAFGFARASRYHVRELHL